MISLKAGLWFSPWMVDNFYSWFTVWHSLAGWLSGCSHSMVRLVFLALSAASDWWLSQWWSKWAILCQVSQICHRKPCSWHTTPHWLLLTRCVTDSHWLWIPAGCLWEDVCSDMKPPLLETSFHFHFLPSTAAEFWPIVLMHLVGLIWFDWLTEFLLFLIVDHFLMRSLHSKAQFFCWFRFQPIAEVERAPIKPASSLQLVPISCLGAALLGLHSKVHFETIKTHQFQITILVHTGCGQTWFFCSAANVLIVLCSAFQPKLRPIWSV